MIISFSQNIFSVRISMLVAMETPYHHGYPLKWLFDSFNQSGMPKKIILEVLHIRINWFMILNIFTGHLGRHLEFLKTLNDASWASSRFWKYMTSCTQISHNLFGGFFCKVFKLAAGLYLKPPNSLNCTVTCTINISQINFFSLFDNFDIHLTFDLGLVWRSISMVWLTS